MEYTIQTLAEAAGVSVRALRYYEEIGLVVPSIRMVNGRHRYGLEEMIRLARVLSLKELGFSLKKIQAILGEETRNKIGLLIAQKKVLLKEQERVNRALRMIQMMITHCKGETKMDQENLKKELEMFKEKKEYAKYFDEAHHKEVSGRWEADLTSAAGVEYCEAQKKKAAAIGVEGAREYGRTQGLFLGEIFQAAAKGVAPESPEVQKLVEENWHSLKQVLPEPIPKAVYLLMCDMVTRAPYQYSEFLRKAMTLFAEKWYDTKSC